jgi:hypothetical protein
MIRFKLLATSKVGAKKWSGRVDLNHTNKKDGDK